MAVIRKENLAELQGGTRGLDESFAAAKMVVGDRKFKRRPTASVCEIMRRQNNFITTGARGLAALGILSEEFIEKSSRIYLDEKKKTPNPAFDPQVLLSCVPSIAEALVLLDCETEDLAEIYEGDTKKLARMVFEFMDENAQLDILKMLPVVRMEFHKINLATAVVENPEGGKGSNGKTSPKKKRTHAG